MASLSRRGRALAREKNRPERWLRWIRGSSWRSHRPIRIGRRPAPDDEANDPHPLPARGPCRGLGDRAHDPRLGGEAQRGRSYDRRHGPVLRGRRPRRARHSRTSARWCPGEPIGFADIPPGPPPATTPTPTTPAPKPPGERLRRAPGRQCACKARRKRRKPKTPGKHKPKPQVETQPEQELKAPVKPEGERGSAGSARAGAPPSGPRPAAPTAPPSPATPASSTPSPGPSTAQGVPNFVIRKFRVPVFLLPIYQAAGIQYGVRWEVLAAINEIETDYGRNLNVSSAGALGWMQFMPATWRQYGTDANKDGKKDPYNPVDAIFAAARYLKAAGYEKDVRRSIFAYNHADWYVDSVMLRARLIAGVPADLVGSLTGLTEGRFPVAARARYADDLKEQKVKKAKAGQNAANVVESKDDRRVGRDLRQGGRPRGGHQRRPGQEDRRLQEARPLRDRPGRVRQPLHLRGAGLGGQDLRRPARGRGRARRVRQGAEGQPGPQGPLPQPGRLRRPPAGQAAKPRRPARSARPPAPRPRSSSACSPTRRCPAAATTAARTSCWRCRARASAPTTATPARSSWTPSASSCAA